MSTANEPPWMAVARVEALGGVREIEGAGSNARIVEYLRSTTYPDALIDANGDSIAWCASFVNWCLLQAGYRGTGKANARSYLTYGAAVTEPQPGDIVVLSRPPSPTSGHVALFVKLDKNRIVCLGGNQGNRVCQAPYPKARLLAYRRPTEKERIV